MLYHNIQNYDEDLKLEQLMTGQYRKQLRHPLLSKSTRNIK